MVQVPKHKLVLEVPGGAKRVLLHTCCAPCSSAIIEIMLQQGITPTIFYSNSNIFPLEEYLHRKDECTRYAQSLGLEIVDDDYEHADWRSCAALGLENEPERGARCLACFKYRLLRAARYASAHGFTVLTTTLASSRWKDLAQVDAAGRWACAQVNAALSPACNIPNTPACDQVNATTPACNIVNSPTSEQLNTHTSQACNQVNIPNNQACDTVSSSLTTCQPDLTSQYLDPSSQHPDPLTCHPERNEGSASPVIWWGQNWRKGGLQDRRSQIIREMNFYNQQYCGCEYSLRNK